MGKDSGGTGIAAGIGDGKESGIGDGLSASGPSWYSEPLRFKVGRLGFEASLLSLGFLGICAEEALRLMTGVEFERPLTAGLEAVGGGRVVLCEGRVVASWVETGSGAEIPRPFVLGLLSSADKEGMSSVEIETARRGSESGDEIKSCI